MPTYSNTFQKSRFLLCFGDAVWMQSASLGNAQGGGNIKSVTQTGPDAVWIGKPHEVGASLLSTTASQHVKVDIWMISNNGATARKITVTYDTTESRPLSLNEAQGPALDWVVLKGVTFAAPVDMPVAQAPSEVQTFA